MINEQKLNEKLDFLGYSDCHKGTEYIRAAVVAVDAQRDWKLTAVYATIAKAAGTNPANVERCIRAATEAAVNAAGWEPGAQVFGNCIATRTKPNNAEVIARLRRLCHED